MSVLQLDLNNLTPAHLAEAKPHCGDYCRYFAPCIIGTIVPKEQRRTLDYSDTEHPNLADSAIGTLLQNRFVSFPNKGQEKDAIAMQAAFDAGDWDDVEQIAERYINAAA
jgi:hypothetical protein